MAPTQPPVVSQEGAIVGDENIQAFTPEVAVNDAAVPAQVSPPREAEPAEVPVYETSIAVDKVITDPSSPEAVQIPDAGRGSLDLPIHRLANGTPEQQLSGDSEEAPEAEPVPEQEELPVVEEDPQDDEETP